MDNPVDKVDNSPRERNILPSGPTLCIFAKQPLPGRVKTRLSPPLTPEEACSLYRTALGETIARLRVPGLQRAICYAGGRDWFSGRFPDVPLLAQTVGDLGRRLSEASATCFAAGAGPLLLTGSDSPDLPLALLEETMNALTEADLVTIPCRDGGYALIGLRQHHPGIFAEIPWSTSGVLQATRLRASDLNLRYRETAPWDDLDDLPALRRLVARSPASQTAVYLRHKLGHYL